MSRNSKTFAAPSLAPSRDTLGNLSGMMRRLGLKPVPAEPCRAAYVPAQPAAHSASWPTGVSLLAQMVDACQRCETTEVCNDWLARAPNTIAVPPDFCRNADALTQAKKAK